MTACHGFRKPWPQPWRANGSAAAKPLLISPTAGRMVSSHPLTPLGMVGLDIRATFTTALAKLPSFLRRCSMQSPSDSKKTGQRRLQACRTLASTTRPFRKARSGLNLGSWQGTDGYSRGAQFKQLRDLAGLRLASACIGMLPSVSLAGCGTAAERHSDSCFATDGDCAHLSDCSKRTLKSWLSQEWYLFFAACNCSYFV